MIAKQDRHGVRTASDLVRRYKFRKKFSETLGVATDARKEAEQAMAETIELSDNISLKATHDIPGKKTIIDLLVDDKKYSGEIDMSDFYTREEIDQLAQDLVVDLEESIGEAIKNIPTGITKTILWENASMNSSFGAQTITVSALTEFEDVEVEFLRESSSTEKIYVRACLPVRGSGAGSVVYGYYSASSQWIERRIALRSNTTINISGTYKPSTTTVVTAATSMLKPYRIYGIKGVKIL